MECLARSHARSQILTNTEIRLFEQSRHSNAPPIIGANDGNWPRVCQNAKFLGFRGSLYPFRSATRPVPSILAGRLLRWPAPTHVFTQPRRFPSNTVGCSGPIPGIGSTGLGAPKADSRATKAMSQQVRALDGGWLPLRRGQSR